MHRQSPLIPLIAAAAVVAGPFCASTLAGEPEFEQHAAHEHGHVTINVALEAGTLVVEWSAPAQQVLGFEHAPRTARERAAADAASQWIRRASHAVGLPPSAGCRVQSVEYTPPALTHDARDHGAEHADYRARYRYGCAAPASLMWFEPWLLRPLIALEHAEINVISPGVQRQVEARDATERIALR